MLVDSNTISGFTDARIDMVMNTLKFQGVKVVNFDVDKEVPTFSIKIYTKKISKPVDYVLNFTYWALWCLIYGKYSEDKFKNNKIEVLFIEVDGEE